MVDASACKSFVRGGPQEFLASNRVWNPGFDQNTVLDSVKSNLSWQETGFDGCKGSGIHHNLCTGCGIFALYIGNGKSLRRLK